MKKPPEFVPLLDFEEHHNQVAFTHPEQPSEGHTSKIKL